MAQDREAFIYWLQARYSVEQMSDAIFKTQLDLGNSRQQMVFVFVWQDNFSVFSPVIEYNSKNATRLLDSVSEKGILGVTVFSDMLGITNVTLNFDGPTLDSWLITIAHEADELESALSRGQDNL